MAVAPTKWEQKRAASRQAIVEAAVRRFHDDGYAATRVEDIVAGTGYTKGAFYFHFANKLECFWAAVEQREELRGDWATVADGFDRKSASLEEVLRAAFAHFAERLDGLNAWVLVMVDCYQQHRDDADVRAHLEQIYARWQDELRRFLAALQRGGWISAERDLALLATETFAFAEGLTTHAHVYRLDPARYEAALFDGLVGLLGR